MNIEIPEVDFSFEALLKRRADKLSETYLNLYTFQDPYQGTMGVSQEQITQALWDINVRGQRIIFINYILIYVKKMKADFLANKQSVKPENANRKEQYEKGEANTVESFDDMQYFLYDLLSKEGFNPDSNSFSDDELYATENKIDEIISALDKLHFGHESIYSILEDFKQDLESLKGDVTSGKKRFYQRAAGVVATYGTTLVADAIFDPIKPMIHDLLTNHTPQIIEKLLK